MIAKRTGPNNYRIEVSESEIRCLQFLAKFFLALDKAVFTGRFMRRVERIHAALEGME